MPKFDESKREFVEPYLPNNKIGIMHLAAGIWKEGKDMRLDKSIKIEIKSLNDNVISKSLRFGKSWKKIEFLKTGSIDKREIFMYASQKLTDIERDQLIN